MTRLSRTIGTCVLLAACGRGAGGTPPLGFTRASVDDQLGLERRFSAAPDPARIREAHRFVTNAPHPAGSARDRALAEWIAERFAEAGMEEIRISTHDVLLPRPRSVNVRMLAPERWEATLREDPMPEDPDTRIAPDVAGVPYHAYSASGEVTARLVYAGDGAPAAYEWLAANGVDVRGAIVLVRSSTPYSYRGYKAFVAEQRGAAGILMYPAASSDAGAGGRSPGPNRDGRIERGSVLYDFLVPGDPLTPGWASIRGAARVRRDSAVSLPKIVSAPVSANDAHVLLQALGGPAAPSWWNERNTYRVGGGPAEVRLRVEMDEQVRPVWTVTGLFRGAVWPDELVLVGNHRDAWVFGGVDASSGTAALAELALSLGAAFRGGARPRRSILLASWDAEELGLTSSTEWAEENAAALRERAIAYLNVDSAVAGPRLAITATPSLAPVLAEAASVVADPDSGVSLATAAAERLSRDSGVSRPAAAGIVGDRLGGGSDYVVFVNHLGIPAANLGFEGPNDAYHTIYDTHAYVARTIDPGFLRHAALVQLWGLAALRLANADAVPLDPAESAGRIAEYVRELTRQIDAAADRAAADTLSRAAAELQQAAGEFKLRRTSAVEGGDRSALIALNRAILRFERAFLDDHGLPGRPWYRHLIYAPRFTYEPMVLPGVAEALARNDGTFGAEASRLAAALRRAAGELGAMH